MGWAKIKGKLTSRIGRPVSYGAPQDIRGKGGQPSQGKIIDEMWVTPSINNAQSRKPSNSNDWGDYSFCAQLIEFDDGYRNIRLAYYRRRAGEDHWEYASQMTVSSDPETMKMLCEKTLAMTAWFEENT